MDLELLWRKLPDNGFFRLLRNMVERYFDHGVGRSAAALTYYTIFSFFPFLGVVSGFLALLHLPPISMSSDLGNLLPDQVIDIINGFLVHLDADMGGSFLWLYLVLSLFFTIRAVDHLIGCIGVACGSKGDRSFWQHSLVVVLFTVSLPTAFLASILLLVVGENLLTFLAQYLPIAAQGIDLWSSLRFLILAAILFVILCLLYWLGPETRVPMRRVFPGAVAALVSWLIISAGFSFYVENMGRYSLVYGSIGAIIVLLLWLYLSAMVLLLGAEFNQALDETRRRPRK